MTREINDCHSAMCPKAATLKIKTLYTTLQSFQRWQHDAGKSMSATLQSIRLLNNAWKQCLPLCNFYYD
ncbi:hypothetical protein DPMN_124822 [Dreissena polymorpha]|uniref:Uncharacterized protein n=1 Tax=Dreissena polymorpha TaxID=45954 RepID=A0A9D4JWJ5_DREPO|nr:hypothetical protein DPMN_124822 [Dreissena polymorpha]